MMKRKELTPEEIERRFAKINARPAEELTGEEEASLAEAEAMDDGTAVTLEDYKVRHSYSGKLMLRIPKDLHRELAQAAKANGVSLNQYALYKLSK